MIKDLIAVSAAKLPERVWGRNLFEACLLPYYHIVSDDWVPHVSPLYRFRTVSEFKADLDHFLRDRHPLSLDDFLRAVEQDGYPPKNSFLLTFDDGFREMHDVVAPILREKGVPAVFFLNSASLDNREMIHHQRIALLLDHLRKSGDFGAEVVIREILAGIGIARNGAHEALKLVPWSMRDTVVMIGNAVGIDFDSYLISSRPYLSRDQAKRLLAWGFAIGAHSVDHPLYADLDLADQLRQTDECASFLAGWLACPIRSFAFPHGDKGVIPAFYAGLSDRTTIKLTFGTGGMVQSGVPRHYQRFSMEKTDLRAKAIVSRERLRLLKHFPRHGNNHHLTA